MNDNNKVKLNGVLNVLESDNNELSIEQVLEKFDWPAEIFFITLISQITNELTNIEINKEKNSNNNYNPSFLYKMINLFCNVKYHSVITTQILDYIITKANIDLILDKIININRTKNYTDEKDFYSEFNNSMVNLLLTIMNFNNRGIIDIIINNSNSNNLLNELFTIFSENEYCRNFLYNFVKNFCKYYPNIKSFKLNMNCTIYYLIHYLEQNFDNFKKIEKEINIILLIYKNDIDIIEDTMNVLLITIFTKYEEIEDNNLDEIIKALLNNCFNRLVFGDKKNNIINSGINTNNIKENKNEYNQKFLNFLFNIYKRLINLKLKKSYTLFVSELFLSLDTQQLGVKRYKWILYNTQFNLDILQSLINLKDENLIKIFFTKIMTLSATNNSKNKDDYYMPDYDLYFFIYNLKNIIKNDNEDSERILNIICSMIINLININKAVINILLNKYKIIDMLLALINNEKYNNKIRNKIIDLLEEILKLNSTNYQYAIKIPIPKDINDINLRLYYITLLYENNIKSIENKITDFITNMLLYINENNFLYFFSINDIIINYIINNKLIKIHLINYNIISKLNNLYVYASQKIIEHENQNEIKDIKGLEYLEIKKKLVDYLIKSIYELNMKNFKNKLNKTGKVNFGKIIFSENTLFIVIKNLLSGKTKKEILKYFIYDICLDKDINLNNNIDNNNRYNINNIKDDINDINDINNNEINDDNEDVHYNYYLCKSSKILFIIIAALYENKDEKNLCLFFNILEKIIYFSEINIKLLLNFDIISFMVKSLLQTENQSLIEEIKSILTKIIKYLDGKSLVNYISIIYLTIYDTLINEGNNEKKKDISIELLNIIKLGLSSSKKTNCNYLSISDEKLCNPYIYNLFYITGLYKKKQIINFSMNIRIFNNYEINNFHIATFINPVSSSMLSFVLNKNEIIITQITNKKEKNMIKVLDNINNYLYDNNFHNISIILNFSSKTINIIIDSNEIKAGNNNPIILNNNFSLDTFDIIIGYEPKNNNNDKNISNLPIIDISNILILKYDNNDEDIVINKKKDQYKGIDILELFIKEKNSIIGQLISAEFTLKNNDINFIKSKNVKNISPFLYNNYLTDKNNNCYNKYIAHICHKNPFNNEENNNSCKSIDLFMLSFNYNIEEYYSINNIIVEYYINKDIIKSLVSKSFDISSNACNFYFVDFLIGFLYLFEKKRKTILNKNLEDKKNNNNNNDKEKEKDKDKDKDINENNNDIKIEDNINFEDNFINDFIIIIFEIIFELQNKKIINYFLYENDIINIKIKHFFERNIQILNNKQFVEKLLSILKMTKMSDILDLQNNSSQIYLLNIITKIFLNLVIFKKLNNEIKNIILFKLYSMLNNITSKNNNNIYNILYELFVSFYNIIIFTELSTDIIDNEKKRTQMDIILQCVQKIYNIFETDYKILSTEENVTYLKKIKELNEGMINLSNEFQVNMQTHNVHQFIEQNIDILSDTFLENDLIKEQIKKFSEFLIQFDKNDDNNNDNNNNNDNDNIINISFEVIRKSNINFNLNISNEKNNKNNNILKKCSYCLYLNNYFKIYFDFYFDDIKYDKYYKQFYRNLFLNFKEFRNIVQSENNMFVWFLSSKETSHRIQNKFFLKENDVKILPPNEKKKNKTNINLYEYIYDKIQYIKLMTNFHKLFIYDNISKDSHFIGNIYKNKEHTNKLYINIIHNDNEISDNIINCIYIKKLNKSLSLFLLNKDHILILSNIFIDLNNKIHVNKNELDKTIICLKNEKYISYFEKYVKDNDTSIVNELFKQIKENKSNRRANAPKFGLDKNYKFFMKKIYYKKISEMKKVSHLQIPNGIEIITTNGENHFIVFLQDERDIIFSNILKKLGISTEPIKKHLKSSIFLGSSKAIQKLNKSLYMKYCPTYYLENHEKDNINIQKSNNEKSKVKNFRSSTKDLIDFSQNKKYTKSLIELNSFVHEISDLWAKNKISNYDYIMALNFLSGRSLNDLTQYYVFPWIIKDFDHKILNWFNSSLYRNLTLPLFACELNLDELKTKYELQGEDDKYFCGTFYSTSAYVCYFLARQRPYTEIHLEINGAKFDCPDRLFIGKKELSVIKDKTQELIPAIFNLAETYINTNKFKFGKTQKNQMDVEDFILPQWSKDDPRKFILILRKILENEKVSKKLNSWIDLIFGFKQSGVEAIKSYNLFRKACYESSPIEIEEKIRNNELFGYLYEKQELGYVGKQLFKKSHKKKDNCEEFKEKKKIFFDNNKKIMKMKVEQIINQKYEDNKNIIKFKKINDIFIFYNKFHFEDHLNCNFKGGISSLRSIMNALNGSNKSSIYKKNPIEIKKKLSDAERKKNSYILLGNDTQFIGKKIDNVIKYNKKYIQIIDIKNCIYSCYYLNELSNISCLTTNEKGNKIFIGFENGNIFEYKIKTNPKTNYNAIYPFMYLIQINQEQLINEKIFNLNLCHNMNNPNNIINNEKKNPNNYNMLILQKSVENNFSLNNPHIPEEISCLKLNEEHNVLIASTIKNLLYIISTNNNFKLMHIVDFLYEFPKKIKDIIPLSFYGDFLIYTSLNVFLFNINGVPLCELNLLNKENENLSKIKYVTACFIYDVILFTAHEDGTINLWKVKNKNVFDNYNERISYIYNENNTKSFLSEYNYAYNVYYYENNNMNIFSNNKIINEYELQRKFDLVSKIKTSEKINSSIIFMKMSREMNYMLILDEKMNIFILSDFDDYNLDNNSEKKIKKEKKNACIWCKKSMNNDYFRVTHISSISNFDNNELYYEIEKNEAEIRNNTQVINKNVEEVDINKIKEGNFMCEECKQKLIHTENYLYNY